MQRIGAVLLPAVLVTAIITQLEVVRAACSCSSTDTAFYPLGSSSESAQALLQCFYPAVSRCQYNATDGVLIKDTDRNLCPTTSSGNSCPSTDLSSHPLGPGSGVHGSILFCTYPIPSELSDQSFYCLYNQTTGVLSSDVDDGLCPTAVVGECTRPSTPTSASISTAHVEQSTTKEEALTTLSVFASPTTHVSGHLATATVSSAIPSTSSGDSDSSNASSRRRITAIAIGSAVSGCVFLLVAIFGLIIFRRGTTENMFTPFPFVSRNSPYQGRRRAPRMSVIQRNPYAPTPPQSVLPVASSKRIRVSGI